MCITLSQRMSFTLCMDKLILLSFGVEEFDVEEFDTVKLYRTA
ncbi:hypothetical protein NIES2104_53980 [Leptolyngbya sp. NIES-2104]|nr:hypothetical protein NIES2104_53980 [Leptolyngbya sp. NIES-2104]